MKSLKPLIKYAGIRRSIGAATTSAALCASLLALPALADEELEYEPREGYHEEEWYDPSDWFNEDDRVSYEDGSSAYNNDSYNNDSYSNDDYWSDDYADSYYPMIYSYYIWDPATSDWSEDSSGDSSQTANNQRHQNQSNQNQSKQYESLSTLSGKIDGFRSVDLSDQNGVREKHSFVKVDLKDGTSRIISLGDQKNKGDLSLAKGNQIEVTGELVKVDGRKALLADTIFTDGLTYTIKDKRQPDLARNRDQGSSTKSWQSSERSSQYANNRSAQNRSTFSGTIDGFRGVDLSDQDGVRKKHSFVKVDLKDGTSRVISLGEQKSKGDLSLSKGDEIRVTGKTVKVDGRKVLLADTIRTDGESFTIKDQHQPDLSKSNNQWQKSSQDRMVTRRGTVKDHTTVDLDGMRSDNLIVRLEMEDGRSCLVDLGSGTQLDELGLSNGDQIMIQGEQTQTRVNGKNLLVANRLRVEGEQQNIRSRDGSSGTTREYRSDQSDATSSSGNRESAEYSPDMR